MSEFLEEFDGVMNPPDKLDDSNGYGLNEALCPKGSQITPIWILNG